MRWQVVGGSLEGLSFRPSLAYIPTDCLQPPGMTKRLIETQPETPVSAVLQLTNAVNATQGRPIRLSLPGNYSMTACIRDSPFSSPSLSRKMHHTVYHQASTASVARMH